MSDTPDTSPAGGSESEPVSLSMDAAVEMLERSEREPEPSQPSGNPEPDHSPETTAEAEGDEGQEADEGAPELPEGGDGQNAPEDNDTVEFEKLHGNTKVVLRDGTVWTAGQLKARIDDLQRLDAEKQTFTSEREQFHQYASQIAQQAQQFEQIAPQAIAAITAQLPVIPEWPDLALRQTDPFAYQEQLDDRYRAIEDYNAKAAQIQQIEQQREHLTQQQQHQISTRKQEYLADQQNKLLAAVPELRDPAKRQAFATEYLETARSYGFSDDETNKSYDHRIVLMAKDAAAYRKLMANKPKPAPVRTQAAPPVAQPGRRVSGQEAQQVRREELSSRVNKPGGLSMSEAVALFEKSQKD